ncbi:coiled-coil domain-containing protein 178 [Caloenas nicobarica]|uniref:coiled-coil domain-containing protein 178 n=1 Tax=Caloenas nicobarica TaxID=187106 RepID=UPI0032B766FA
MFETQSFPCSSKDSNEPSQEKNERIIPRHRSCAFVNTPLPCVNKVIHHIQELELKMEKFFQQYAYVFKEEKTPWITKQVSVESVDDVWLSLSTKLDFKEADVSCEDGETLTLKQETEALLLEVTELIKRLEADREEAEKALELEKKRGKKLAMKIDSMSLWRLQQLPAAVQKEYEMCVQDILELQWHLDCKSCQLRQVQNQILNTERVNRRIQDNIDFMKKYSPLLEKKLNLEEESVKDVLLTYEKTSKIYSDLCCELMDIQKIIKRTEEESEEKIKSMYEKIENDEMLFSQYKKELKHSEFTWTEYCMKLKETEEKIIKDEKHLEELVKQKAEIQEDAKSWNGKVNNLNNKLAAQGHESRKISDAYSEVVKAVEELKSTRERDLQSIKRKLLNISEPLNILKHGNEELERENEEFLNNFRHSSRKQEVYQSEIKTACKSMCEIEERIERLNEDLYNAALSYSEKSTKYLDLKKNKTEEEVSFKNSEQNLKKEIEDQKELCEVAQYRIQAIYDDLEEKQKENLKKREEDMKRIEQIERQVADLETKLKRNKDILKEKSEKFSCLDQRVQELDKQQKQTEQQLEQKRSTMQQQLNYIQEKYSIASSQIAENFRIAENFKNELKELNELWNMKQIQMENTEKCLPDLRKNLSDVMFKQQTVQMVFNHLQDELAEYEKRLKQEEETYGELLQIRKKDLKDSEATLDQLIKENLWLAQEYQIFQNYYLNIKENLIELYSKKIRVETAVRDHQQLRALQRRLRGARAARRRRRGRSIQAGLARLQAASQENAQKILAVQGELSKAIQHITAFLCSLTDGSPTIDNDGNNQCILDAEIKDKKSHTVQITV